MAFNTALSHHPEGHPISDGGRHPKPHPKPETHPAHPEHPHDGRPDHDHKHGSASDF